MQIKRLQAAMLAVLGPASSELLDAISHHGITVENCRVHLADVVSEIKSFLNTLPIPEVIPEKENKGLLGIQRWVYVEDQYVLSEEQENQVTECFALENLNDTDVHPTAVYTLQFNAGALLDKTLKMLEAITPESTTHEHEHIQKHIARLVTYLNVLQMYLMHCAARNYDHHAAVVETLEENRSELLTEMESAEDEQMMLYEGVECLLAGREPSTKGELFTQGVLTANSVYNVFGGEAWYDSIMVAINKVIEKLKAGWEWFANLFKGDKAPKETIEKAEEASKTALVALEEKIDKADTEAGANEEFIKKLMASFESLDIQDADIKARCTEILGKLKELLTKKGKSLVDGIKSVIAATKTFYEKYASKAVLAQKGKNALDAVTRMMNKLKGVKPEDKAEVAKEREALEGELQIAKELEKEARTTIKTCERIGSPLIKLMYNPTNFIML